MKNNLLELSAALLTTFSLARCRSEGDRIYIRYATGYSEYLTAEQATAILEGIRKVEMAVAGV